MEINSETRLKFGDFESSLDIEPSDDCVEFPPSWLIEDAGEYELSFSVPNQCNGGVIPKEKERLQQQLVFGFDDENSHVLLKSTEKTIADSSLSEKVSYNNIIAINQPTTEPVDEKVPEKESNESNSDVVDSNSSVTEDVALNGVILDSVVTKEAAKSANENKTNGGSVTAQTSEPQAVKPVESKAINAVSNYSEIVSQEEKPSPKPGHSWAGLFKSKENASKMVSLSNNKEIKIPDSPNISHSSESEKIENVVNGAFEPAKGEPENLLAVKPTAKPETVKADKHTELLAKLLAKLELKFKPQAFIPRGLINASNWCYINATLQALLMCPPFFQLLKSLPLSKADNYSESSTPTIDCFVKLASEFYPLSTKKGYQTGKDIRQGSPFAPECVYDMLSATKSSLSESGRQEDAEEFLSCVLNGLHEEMVKLFQLSIEGQDEITKDSVNGGIANYSPPEKNATESDGEEWEEVITTKRNRSAVTRRADTSKTPISKIFRGELCTSVFRPGQKLSISHEPFYCLPLFVPTENDCYWSVDDAMHALTNKENFYGSDADQAASRQQVIEILPPILILHLKRFVYDKNGGLKKLDRKMDFKSDMVIQKELLSKTSKKYSHSQRTYKLFAVVCHHGERATGGHYSADVFHIGMSAWLRIDDQNIQTVSHNDVTRYNVTRTPYLLFYRRTDLG